MGLSLVVLPPTRLAVAPTPMAVEVVPRQWVPPLAMGLPDVLTCLSANASQDIDPLGRGGKMVRIHAARRLTEMVHDKPVRNAPVLIDERDTMSVRHGSIWSCRRVVRVRGPNEPTPFWVLVHALPEPVFA